MKLELYNTKDSKDTINKTLTLVSTININLKANTDILNPLLLLTRKDSVNYEKVNYAKMYNRCYNITRIEFPNKSFVRLSLQEDVLETYKNVILNSNSEIVLKNEPSYSTTKITSDSRNELLKYVSDKDFKKQESYILVTIGG